MVSYSGGGVMAGPCGDTLPPLITRHVGELWHKLWYHPNSFLQELKKKKKMVLRQGCGILDSQPPMSCGICGV